MLRHQRRRLEEDCLTVVLLIKRAEVSPLSGGLLFSFRLETETEILPWLFSLLSSPRLGCDFRTGFMNLQQCVVALGF